MNTLKTPVSSLSRTEDRLVLTETDGGFSFILEGAEEFIVYCKVGGEIYPVRSSDTVFCGASDEKDGFILKYEHSIFSADVHYFTNGCAFFKTVAVKIKTGCTVLRISAETRSLSQSPFRGGEGQPVFAEAGGACAWIGMESPAVLNTYNGNTLNITEPLFETGAAVKSTPVSYGVSKGDAFTAFCAYMRKRAVKTKPFRVYSDWALRDDFTPGDPTMSEQFTLKALDMIERFNKKSGLKFDCYLMDAFWFAKHKPYTEFDREKFPNGIKHIAEKIKSMGMSFGLWFDINGIHTRLCEVKGYEKYSSDIGNEALCLACDKVADLIYGGLKKQIVENGVSVLKLDFAYFECKNGSHNHSTHPDEYKAKAVKNFIKIISKLRKIQPDLKVLCYNGFTTELGVICGINDGGKGFVVSPYWCEYVDYVYCGDPRPSETPFSNLADSVNHYTDAMYYGFYEAAMPLANIEDDGVLVGSTATIYRQGRNTFRRGILSCALRGTKKLHFYGDLDLLTDDDVLYYKRVDAIFEDICSKGFQYRLLPGNPRRDEPYGYRAYSADTGYALIFKPTPGTVSYNLNLPGKCFVKTVIEDGNIKDKDAGTFDGSCPVKVSGCGYTLVYYEAEKGDPGLYEVPLLPGDVLKLNVAGCGQLQLMFKGENGLPLRLPTGLAEGIRVSSGKKELAPQNTQLVWSGVSWTQYGIKGKKTITVSNGGQTAVKLKYRMF